jgi:3-oxoacyl-(acyl-carrier-protein) synthase
LIDIEPSASKRASRGAIAITGMGCIGAPGLGLLAQAQALSEGWCGLQTRSHDIVPLARELPVGRVTMPLPPLPSRTAALAAAAAHEALDQAGFDLSQRGDIAVIVGSSTAGMAESEHDFLTRNPETAWPSYRRQQTHRTTHMVARLMGCGGIRATHSVACASAACAIIEAMELVRSGACAVALAIGSDALTRLTMSGFNSLKLVDPRGCRPLIQERGGMSLGEGAGALVLENPEHARRRNATVRASLLGWGMRADAYHVTSPDPSAEHLMRTIRDSLGDADLSAREIDYVCAHGTGTSDNDPCEAKALSGVFGSIPTASFKRTYGHTMGASAAIEAVASCLALSQQSAFPSAGAELGTPIAGPEIVRRARQQRLGVVCSTTLAFGGVNASLLFGGAHRCA